MKNYFKKGLAFLLACALMCGEFLPASAAEPVEPSAMTGEEMTQEEQNAEPEALDEEQVPEEVPESPKESVDVDPEPTEPELKIPNQEMPESDGLDPAEGDSTENVTETEETKQSEAEALPIDTGEEKIETLDQWSGTVVLDAGEKKYFEFSTSEVMDYLVEIPEQIDLQVAEASSFVSRVVDGTDYQVFTSDGSSEIIITFEVENKSDKTEEVSLLTAEEAAEELAEGRESSGENPYFTFTAAEEGYYLLKSEHTEDQSLSVVLFKRAEQEPEILDDAGIFLTEGETVIGRCLNYDSDGREIVLPFAASKVLAMEEVTVARQSEDNTQPVWVQSVKLQAPVTALEPGDEMVLTPVPTYKPDETPDSETVYTWKSSNENIASVDGEGKVTALKEGMAVITVTADETLRAEAGLKPIATATVKLTVTNPPTSYTTLKSWEQQLSLTPRKTVNYSFTSSMTGDYLIEQKDGITFEPKDMPEGVDWQDNIYIPATGKTYICLSFADGEKKTCKFSLKNITDQKETVDLITPLKQESFWKEAGWNTTYYITGSENMEYYRFTAEELGIYSISGGTIRWVCNKNGNRLDASSMLLLPGETCYISFAGVNDSFSISKNEGEELLSDADKTAVINQDTKYRYTPTASGKCIAFTSRMYQDDITLTYDDGTGLKEWAYDAVTGNYSINVTKGRTYALSFSQREETGDVSAVTIAVPGYSNKVETSTFKIGSLTDKDLYGIGSASRMSASYKVSKTSIAASGTLGYIANGVNYLGSDSSAYKPGYFLAFRLNVQRNKFKEDGYVNITYCDEATGQRVSAYYEAAEEENGAKKIPADGNIDVILDMTNRIQEVQIRVALDSRTNITTYKLNLASVKTDGRDRVVGAVTEPAKVYGIKTSSPVIVDMLGSGWNPSYMVGYYSMAWSTGVVLPGVAEALPGANYVALKVEVPDSMRNTNVESSVSSSGMAQIVHQEPVGKDHPYVMIVLNAGQGLNETIDITWDMKPEGENSGDLSANSFHQQIRVGSVSDCLMERIPDDAVLPKSIAFNGLATTMYVGQEQNAAVTINRQYVEDTVRLSFSSSDSSVLSVNRVNGMIRALKPGTATVTVDAVAMVNGVEKTISKSSKITVKNLTAPGSVKISNIRDTEATVSWAKNVTGQGFRVYAVPYNSTAMGTKAADWKKYIEERCNNQSDEMWNWRQAEAQADDTSVKITGLEPNREYIFYVQNYASAATGRWYAGTVSGKITMKKAIFGRIDMVAKDAEGNSVDGTEFVIAGTQKPGEAGIPASVSYRLMKYGYTDSDINIGMYPDMDIPMEEGTVFTSVSYKTSNANVMTVDKNGRLKLGTQAGRAELYVTGKDASGAVRTSNVITVYVKKDPSGLKAKTTTLTVGQGIALRELISYNVNGSATEINTDLIDFEEVWSTLKSDYPGYFVLSGDESGMEGSLSGASVLTAAGLLPNKKGVPTSGSSITVDVRLKDTDGNIVDTKKATIKVNAMKEPAVKSVEVRDTSAIITFTPNSTVRELNGDNYFYTASVKDMVTGEYLYEDARDGNTEGLDRYSEVYFSEAAGSTDAKPVYLCSIENLSPGKKYEVKITAHYDVITRMEDGNVNVNTKDSAAKSFTTKDRLLPSEGNLNVKWDSMTDLKNNGGMCMSDVWNRDYWGDDDSADNPDDAPLYLENNETYVFVAEVDDLARALETDKLKWTISSGDKNAAAIKASSSTFEAQLKTVRTGTFTITATSTVTKEVLITFRVEVIPYQSTNRGADTASEGRQAAYLGGIPQTPFSEEKKKTA